MAAFPAGYTMVPNNVGGYGIQPYYSGMNYQMAQQPNGYSVGQMMQNPVSPQAVVQPTQVAQPMVIGGKMVDSMDVVKATDIPMDGATYYFPKPDGSEIYTKSWSQDGRCEVVTYKREIEPPSEETKEFMNSFLVREDVTKMQDSLSQKLDSILERVSRLEEVFK